MNNWLKNLLRRFPDMKTGAVVDRRDERDYDFAQIAAGLPAFDWQKGYDVEQELREALGLAPDWRIPTKDQGQSGSCGGQAWAYYAEILEAFATKTFEPRSAKYIYSQTFIPPMGSMGRDNSIILTEQGASREQLLPSYENGRAPSEKFMQRSQDITPFVRVDASAAKMRAYGYVPLDIDAIAQAMQYCHGLVLGILVTNNGTWMSSAPALPVDGENFSRHWLYFGKAKLVNGRKTLIAHESWSDAAGDNGWQMFGEEWVKYVNRNHGQGIWSSWTIFGNPEGVPPAFVHDFQTNLWLGNRGPEVKALQTALQVEGSFSAAVPTTEYYGNITRTAVLKFQMKYGIVANPAESDGGRYCGPKTRSKLNELFRK